MRENEILGRHLNRCQTDVHAALMTSQSNIQSSRDVEYLHGTQPDMLYSSYHSTVYSHFFLIILSA